MKDFNSDEKLFIQEIEEAKKHIKGELELECVENGEWYARDYREELEGSFPIDLPKYAKPLITNAIAASRNIDIIKCCDECYIYHTGF